ncbi:MAG: Gfo/Idh/MocA family oxidoreductase [Chitinophagaceae bacterium]|nr:Gfo/Idh/MocA family oxidoreductase [Chitinophagaceae bacterium]
MNKVRWGILSTAKIAREKVIPAMQGSEFCEIVAIASTNKERAQAESARLNIPKIYDSYDALLRDPVIDAVYIPLPNHLHIEWAIKCLEADKHVLCEKPIGLSSAEVMRLVTIARQKPHLKVMEAFMYRFHPQWQHTKKLVTDGAIGELKTIQSFFSYYNIDPQNIRNQKAAGGGGMMDIGCYCISLARFMFAKEPERVFGIIELDPTLQTDRLASGILDFGGQTSTFTCSTQLTPYQRVNILGTEARIEIEIPFNAPPDKSTRIWLHSKNEVKEIVFDAVDQYTIQGSLFAESILNNSSVPTPLEDAVNNMRVIEVISESAKQGAWVKF